MIMYIYKITNNINGKIYIGQTVGTVENRFGEHCRASKCNTPIDRAINKYGRENFSVEVLDETNDLEKLNKLEIFYINKYNSTDVSVGYNICDGGEGTMGYHHRPESCIKMSESRMGIFAGEKNPFYGKHHSQEQIEKWKRERKGRKLTDEWKANLSKTSPRKVAVICMTTGERFESMVEAGKRYGIKPCYVSRVCRGVKKSCYGYHFMYDNTVPRPADK